MAVAAAPKKNIDEGIDTSEVRFEKTQPDTRAITKQASVPSAVFLPKMRRRPHRLPAMTAQASPRVIITAAVGPDTPGKKEARATPHRYQAVPDTALRSLSLLTHEKNLSNPRSKPVLLFRNTSTRSIASAKKKTQTLYPSRPQTGKKPRGNRRPHIR